MNCLECQELLQKRLDGKRIAASDEVDQHLSECATCREQHAVALRLLDGLPHLPKPKLPANFAQVMVAQVMRDRRQRQQKFRRQMGITAAMAASVLIALFAAYWWIPRTVNKDQMPKNTIAKEEKKDTPPQKVPDEPKETPRKQEPRHALSTPMERVVDTTRDHAKVLLAATSLEGIDKFNELPADPNMRGVSDGVLTVTHNARRAFDFFARELPMPDVGEQKD